MTLEGWNLILAFISFFTVGGGIASIIALKWSKRNNEAETRKLEESAKQEQKNTDSIAIDNAHKIIEMYKESVEHLTELHRKTQDELEERFSGIEKQFEEYKTVTQAKIEQLEDKIHELLESQEIKCNKCQYSEGCKKKLALLQESSKVSKQSNTSDHEKSNETV